MDQSLEKFVEKMMLLRNEPQAKPLSWDELRNIALEVGLSEADWQQVEATLQTHQSRANSFLKFENLDDAIVEFEYCLDLNPYHTATLTQLANIHLLRWHKQNNDNDLARARERANQALALEPTSEAALRILSELKRIEAPKPLSFKSPVVLAAALGLVVALVGLFFWLKPSDEPYEVIEEIPYVEPEQATQPPTESEAPKTADWQHFTEPNVPLWWRTDRKAAHLELSIESSEFSDYDNSFAYEFKGFVRPTEDIELGKLVLGFRIINQRGDTVSDAQTAALEDYQAAARVGDLIPIDYLYYSKKKLPSIDRVEVYVAEVLSEPSNGTYAQSPSKEFTWASPPPPNFGVELRERLLSVSKSWDNGTQIEVVLEFANSGNSTIEILGFRLLWWDKKGKSVASDQLYATIRSYSKIRRGQTRIYSGTFGIEQIPFAQFSHYTIEINEIK